MPLATSHVGLIMLRAVVKFMKSNGVGKNSKPAQASPVDESKFSEKVLEPLWREILYRCDDAEMSKDAVLVEKSDEEIKGDGETNGAA